MKKILLTMAFVLTALGNAWADDDVTVQSSISIPEGSIATLAISLNNNNDYRQLFQMELVLPEGIKVYSVKLNEKRFNSFAQIGFNEIENQRFRILCQSGTDVASIKNTAGVIVNVQLKADPSLIQGTPDLTGYLENIEVTDQNSQKFLPTNKVFNITIGAARAITTLDESSTTYLTANLRSADVEILRSIKADEWSTICLPFDMSEAQVKEAFGNDVELADLTDWSFTGSAPNMESVNLLFSSVNSIQKLHPYFIKISTEKGNISSFIVQNVDIKASEAAVPNNVSDAQDCVCSVKGVFTAGSKVPDGCLFLSGNKFWSSTGNTNIKGFRAYLQFSDDWDDPLVISDSNASRITMSFVDDATKIKDVSASEDDGSIYNLSGQQVENPAKKGLYITKGKKVVIK